MLPAFSVSHFENLAFRLLRTPNFLPKTRRNLSSQSKIWKPMEIPKGLCRVSERCRLVPSTQRDAWQWPVDPHKVLVVLMPWLGAKDRHIFRYSNLYTDQGVDVLIVNSEPKDFIWPPNSRTLAEQVSKVLEYQMRGYDHFVFHTMSVGSFNWSVLREYLKEKGNPQHLCSKFRGQILDSVTAGAGKGGLLEDFPLEGQEEVHAVDRMIKGIATSANKGPVIQWTIESLAKSYMWLTKKYTIESYERSLKFFREEPLKVPTLFFASRNDPMCDATVLEKLVDIWRSTHSFPLTIKVWDDSPHTQHFIYHPEEYKKLQENLFQEIFTSLPQHYTQAKSKL